jgi:nucleotide-binding universal stress UspA family protein
MKTIVIAVDESTGSQAAVQTFLDLFSCARPERVVLLYVEKMEGRSLMDDMLGEPELSTLKEQLKGSEVQAALDRKAKAVLDQYAKQLAAAEVSAVQTAVREGHPSDEILKAAKELGANMIIIGSRGMRRHTFLMGSVSREIANRAEIPVLIAR